MANFEILAIKVLEMNVDENNRLTYPKREIVNRTGLNIKTDQTIKEFKDSLFKEYNNLGFYNIELTYLDFNNRNIEVNKQ